jgi:histidinol phosphatase-like enzyme
MGIDMVRSCAVFFDRDGVINRHWRNPQTRAWESPIRPEDFGLHDGVIESLSTLKWAGNRMFLLSNQPSATKGKLTLEDLKAVHERFLSLLSPGRIVFDDFVYSHTHRQARYRNYQLPHLSASRAPIS